MNRPLVGILLGVLGGAILWLILAVAVVRYHALLARMVEKLL